MYARKENVLKHSKKMHNDDEKKFGITETTTRNTDKTSLYLIRGHPHWRPEIGQEWYIRCLQKTAP